MAPLHLEHVMLPHLARCPIPLALACHRVLLTRLPQCLASLAAAPKCLTYRSHVSRQALLPLPLFRHPILGHALAALRFQDLDSLVLAHQYPMVQV